MRSIMRLIRSLLGIDKAETVYIVSILVMIINLREQTPCQPSSPVETNGAASCLRKFFVLYIYLFYTSVELIWKFDFLLTHDPARYRMLPTHTRSLRLQHIPELLLTAYASPML
jgi:hypothetical protein